jgi:hypothetical protein
MPMDTATSISLLISIISLLAAAYIGIRQYTTQKNANSVPASFEILAQLQRPAFHDSFQFIMEELDNYDPGQGLAGLPYEAKVKVYDVCYFLQHVAMLIILDLIDERVFTAYFRARSVAVWEKVEPFIQKERVVNPATGPEFLTLFEAFAVKAGRITPEAGQEILAKWLARDNRRWIDNGHVKRIISRQRAHEKVYAEAMKRPTHLTPPSVDQPSASDPRPEP